MQTGRRLGLAAVLTVLALVVAGCGSTVAPTVAPATAPTATPTTAPTATPTVEPTAVPTSTPTPTDTLVIETAITPSVTAADQEIVDGKVVIDEVVSDGPGWLVIHAQANGNPGPVLGYSPAENGTNSNVSVQIDLTAATVTLYAMLHTDAGTIGTWEFPGADVPVRVNDQVVSPAFNLQVASGEAEVEMENFQFSPKTLVIRAGTTVRFSNKDDVPHTATSDTNVWNSGYLSKGQAFSQAFAQPGVYPYYCMLHGGAGGVGMAGTIIVLQ